MKLSENKTLEILFLNFLEEECTGKLVTELSRISAKIDAQIEAGAVEYETVGEYELLAKQVGFYAGFIAGMELQKALPKGSRRVA